jgi:hypothetical protein
MKKNTGRHKCRWKDNFKTDFKEDVDTIHVTQRKVQWLPEQVSWRLNILTVDDLSGYTEKYFICRIERTKMPLMSEPVSGSFKVTVRSHVRCEELLNSSY